MLLLPLAEFAFKNRSEIFQSWNTHVCTTSERTLSSWGQQQW